MTATRPDRSEVVGTWIRLVPLTVEDLPELFPAIAHPIVFAGGFGGGPEGYRDNEADFVEWAKAYYDWQGGLIYGVRLVGGDHDGVLVGASTLGDFDLTNEHAHIGWTAYDPKVWGTAVNAEAKLLILGVAFANGFGRVKIQADVINERSRAAIAGIGATFEGIVRRDRKRADGTWRDSAVFSVIVDDWPVVEAGLRERLARFAGRPVAFRTPRD
jgi:RimJ/RimL family protein N-acetyltransferase